MSRDSGIANLRSWVAVIGGTMGAIALAWRLFDAFKRYLHVELDVHADNSTISIRTMVENKGTFDQKILNALVIIGPQDESPLQTASTLFEEKQFPFTDSFEEITQPKQSLERAAVPLPFYYSENIAIGDERIGCDAILPASLFVPTKAYAVRFYIFGERHLHRSTQRGFVVPALIKPAETATNGGG